MDPDDPRLVRDGRPLRAWLPDLLDADRAVRRRAENAVSAIYWGAPVADAEMHQHMPPDLAAYQKEFGDAVGRLLADPSFRGSTFVILALQRMKDEAARREVVSGLEERLFDADPPLSPEAEAELTKQVREAYAEDNEGKLPNSMGPHALHVVMGHAGPILLGMPDVVRDALRDVACSGPVAKALGHLGAAAVAFAPDLLMPPPGRASAETGHEILDSDALASVGRHDDRAVRELIERVKHEKSSAAFDTASTLGKMGPAAAVRVPTLVAELMPLFDDRDRAGYAIRALAPITPDRRDVFDRVLAAARAKPPDIQHLPDHPDHPYDATMWHRGQAIEALAHFRRFAAEAVPVLADALDTFQEYDPDWTYGDGDHGRVLHALSALIPASAAAVPALLRHLRGADGETATGIIRLLGRIGPAAREALPALRQLEAEEPKEEGDLPSSDPPEEWDVLPWAIYQIDPAAWSAPRE